MGKTGRWKLGRSRDFLPEMPSSDLFSCEFACESVSSTHMALLLISVQTSKGVYRTLHIYIAIKVLCAKMKFVSLITLSSYSFTI